MADHTNPVMCTNCYRNFMLDRPIEKNCFHCERLNNPAAASVPLRCTKNPFDNSNSAFDPSQRAAVSGFTQPDVTNTRYAYPSYDHRRIHSWPAAHPSPAHVPSRVLGPSSQQLSRFVGDPRTANRYIQQEGFPLKEEINSQNQLRPPFENAPTTLRSGQTNLESFSESLVSVGSAPVLRRMMRKFPSWHHQPTKWTVGLRDEQEVWRDTCYFEDVPTPEQGQLDGTEIMQSRPCRSLSSQRNFGIIGSGRPTGTQTLSQGQGSGV